MKILYHFANLTLCMAKNMGLDGSTGSEGKIDRNNQCQWTVGKRLCLFCTETQHDLSSVLEKNQPGCNVENLFESQGFRLPRVLGRLNVIIQVRDDGKFIIREGKK